MNNSIIHRNRGVSCNKQMGMLQFSIVNRLTEGMTGGCFDMLDNLKGNIKVMIYWYQAA